MKARTCKLILSQSSQTILKIFGTFLKHYNSLKFMAVKNYRARSLALSLHAACSTARCFRWQACVRNLGCTSNHNKMNHCE